MDRPGDQKDLTVSGFIRSPVASGKDSTDRSGDEVGRNTSGN